MIEELKILLTDWNFWFSVITALVAIIAIFQTGQQLRASNKQSLFDRRISNYTIIMELVRNYEENRGLFTTERNDGPIFWNNLGFLWLTNTSFLQEIYEVIEDPLYQPKHKAFLKKCGELKEIAETSRLIFTGRPAELINEFILHYEEALFKMYQYQILLNKMQEASQKLELTLEESIDKFYERERREKLLSAHKNLSESYEKIKENCVVERIRKQIRL